MPLFKFFNKKKEPTTEELAWFGIRMDTGRPILERVKKNRCRKCKGFGTYGNPLAGVLYTCQECKGTGYGLSIKVRFLRLYEKIITYLKG